MSTPATLKLPADVVSRNGLPNSTMTLRSAWPMDDGKFGLWLADGGTQVWPLTHVDADDVQRWTDAARTPEES